MRTTGGTVVDRPETAPSTTPEMIENRIPLLRRPPTIAQQRVPVKPPAPLPTRRDRLPRVMSMLFVALVAAGVAVLAFVLSGGQPKGTSPMGLSSAAWQQYRTGERYSAADLARQNSLEYRTGERATTVDLTVVDQQAYRSGERATDLTRQNWLDHRAGERTG